MTPRRDFWNVLVLGVRLSVLFGLYRRRLHEHIVVELLAACGIAVGVALVFGVLVANSGIATAAQEEIHAVNGKATLKIAARSSSGISEQLARKAEGLRGIQGSASLLREPITLEGARGRKTVQLVGATLGLLRLGGSSLRNLQNASGEEATTLLAGGVGLPQYIAEDVGVKAGQDIKLIAGGVVHSARVHVVFTAKEIGVLSSAAIAVASLSYAQSVTGRSRRVSEVLIIPRVNRSRQVMHELEVLAANRANVVPAGNELGLVQTAVRPITRATDLFVAISVMVGTLLALNAMLLTMPDRRKIIGEMRAQGYDSRQVLAVFGFQALALGVGASLLGIVLGYTLARGLLHEIPGYFTVAFSITSRQVVRPAIVLIAILCGVGASLVASALPFFGQHPNRQGGIGSQTLERPGQNMTMSATSKVALLGMSLIVLATVMTDLQPTLTIVSGILLALASHNTSDFSHHDAHVEICNAEVSMRHVDGSSDRTRCVSVACIGGGRNRRSRYLQFGSCRRRSR
jgi:putative ABC transport system permease protein